jgi:hypothetical protein
MGRRAARPVARCITGRVSGRDDRADAHGRQNPFHRPTVRPQRQYCPSGFGLLNDASTSSRRPANWLPLSAAGRKLSSAYRIHWREAGFECETPIKNTGAGAAMMRVEAARRIFPALLVQRGDD